MNILVSGTTGFVGRHLIKRLLINNHKVIAVVRKTTDVNFLKQNKIKYYIFDRDIQNLILNIKDEKIDGVVHLASLFLAQHKPENVRGLVESNILFATNLLEASVQCHVPWFINTGTFWQHFQNRKYSPVNLYAATKQAFEDIAKYYVEAYGINFVTIKLCDIFGPQDTRQKIFNYWLKISKTNEKLDMSPGRQIIDISYIENVIDGYMKMISLLSKDESKKLTGKSLAIYSNEKMTLMELSRVFERVTKTKLNINWGKREYRPREVMTPWNKGKIIPGWCQKVSLQEGIKRTFYES